MKRLFLAAPFFAFLLPALSNAQFENINPDDLDELHNRSVIVVVEKPSDLISEKLNKKKKNADAYTSAITDFNKNFQDALTKFWKISEGSIDYRTMDEVNDISGSEKKNYVIFFCRSVTQAELTSGYDKMNGILWWPDMKEVAHDKDFSGKMTVLGFALLDELNKAPFYQFPIPDVYPSRADLEYAVSAANGYLLYRVNHRKDKGPKVDEQMIEENQPALKDRTLLLRRDYLKGLTKAEMDKDYPFPYLVTNKDTIDHAIDSADSRYAIAIVAPSTQAGVGAGLDYVQIVYTPDDGLILGSSGFTGMATAQPNASTVGQGKPFITKKNLMDYCMYINEKDTPEKGDKKRKR